MKLLIASPSISGQYCGEYVGSLLGTLGYCHEKRIEVEWFRVHGNSEISRCREMLAAYALRNKFDKMLFIDADQGWRPEHAARLLESDKPIVGGTYPKKEYPLNLNFGCLPQHNHYFPAQLKTLEEYRKFALAEADEKGEVEIAFLPTGLMLIDCSVFEKMKEHAVPYMTKDSASSEDVRAWEFFPIGVINGFKDTEDWGFCRFAAACGFPITLNVHCIASHIGPHVYGTPPGLLTAAEPERPADSVALPESVP